MQTSAPSPLIGNGGPHFLRADGDVVVYRGWRAAGGGHVPVLIQVPTREPPTPASIDRLAHEYELRDELDPAWAARPLDFMHGRGQTMLVLEDPGGDPLDWSVGKPMEIGRFLPVAIGIATALGQAHRRGLIHKDVKPSNILVDESCASVHLTGFGIASRLPHERPTPEPPEVIAGTLAYMAPEQTGRMNRSVDSRSDLYALGVVFYEMLTGTLPFTAADPMEWVYCHIARRALPPVERSAAVPEPISDIVMRLLAKTAEDRYQTAAGLVADLRYCQDHWREHGWIESFPLGGQDLPDVLRIPEILYGREQEVQTLVEAFDGVASRGEPRLILVSGYSGIGKSAVVAELNKAIVPKHGLFACGKSERFQRDIPYATVAQACRILVRQLLVKSDDELRRWRQSILAAVGLNGGLIIELVPELERLIGPQPPVPDLPPAESELRFLTSICRFLGAFAKGEHPLVLFLDDLQWSDPATLKLLFHVTSRPGRAHLLVIGAYRSNEVSPAHPLMTTIEAMRSAEISVDGIFLGPLSCQDICRMVAQAVNAGPDQAEPLGMLVHGKTGGNPFFASQFLMALWEEGFLAFDLARHAWTWHIDEIEARGFTDNVVELMIGKLRQLPATTQTALYRLACLGSRIEVSLLAAAQEASEESVQAALWEAEKEGLILRRGGYYRFLHDRVQEAAYALVPPQGRPAEHLRLGRLLLSHLSREALDKRVFEVVNQLNRGVGLITVPVEREQLARLNSLVGKRAKAAVAYRSALSYFDHATRLLRPSAWDSDYEDTFAVHLDRAECEYLAGRFACAEKSFDLLLARARSSLDRARVYRLRSRLYHMVGRFEEAMKLTLGALKLLGVSLPASKQELRAAAEDEMRAVRAHLGGNPPDRLVELPPATDPVGAMIISLLVEGLNAAYATAPPYYSLLSAKAVSSSLRYGNTVDSCLAYTSYAILLIAADDVEAAFQFSELALALVDRFGNPPTKGAVLVGHGALVIPWRRHITEGLPLLERGIAAYAAAGDFVRAAISTVLRVWAEMEKGQSLDEVSRTAEKYATFAEEIHSETARDTIRLCQQLTANLMGMTEDATSFDGDDFDEKQCLERFTRAGWHAGIAYYHVMQEISAFIYGRPDDVMEAAAAAEPVLGQLSAMPVAATHWFFRALAAAACHPEEDPEKRCEAMRILEEGLAKHRSWANHCPQNFENRYALLGAEAARIEGRDMDAMRLYELAIRSAHGNGFIQNEALANELAGRFYLERGLEISGYAHLNNARACYALWGADGKVRQLDRLYPSLSSPEGHHQAGTIGSPVGQFDVTTVIQASQAVSGEILLPRLIQTLMTIALQSAGADRGLLIRPQEDTYWVEAEAHAGRDKVVEVEIRRTSTAEAELPETVLRYVTRAHESVILGDSSKAGLFSDDVYLRRRPGMSVLCVPLIKQGKLVGVLYLENSLATDAFPRNRIAVLEMLATQAAISLENTRLYGDLQERERKIRRLVESNIIGIIIGNDKGFITEANDAFLTMVGYDREDLAQGRVRWRDMTPPEWRVIEAQAIEQAKPIGICRPFEKEYFRKDGTRVPALVGIASLSRCNDQGIAFVLDLTERKQAEERQKLLLDELNHRVKNALATVLAISTQTLRTANSPQEFHEAFEGRLLALSETHNLLNRNSWQGVNLHEVLEQELAPYAGTDKSRLVLSGDDLRLGPVAAVTMGMAFHELATNAAKYGALSAPSGRVEVVSHLSPSNRLHLEWREVGGPPVRPPRRQGFGLRLVERTLPRELNGQVHLDFSSQGVRCAMDMSLDRMRAH